nr:hypothetical protein [Tanacetum cinerariifolium]
MASNPENVRLSVLAKLQEALNEEDILADQILTMMHRYADRFTNRRVKINNLMVLQDHPLVDYGRYALGCMTGDDMKKCVHLKSVRDELLRRISPVAIIDHQLAFEYTIVSRSTDVMVELKSMFEKQARVERFDLIQTFHACKQEEGKPVGQYVLKMKGYVEQLERLGYVLSQDISVGLILNGLTIDFAGFVRNYNMHNMGKTIGELHALLFEYEKGLPKKSATPQVMAIQVGRIHKANKKSQKAKGKGKGKGKGKDKSYIPKPKNPKLSAKEHPTKNDVCYHCKEVGHWKRNYPIYLAELMKNKKQVGTASSSGKMTGKSFPHRLERATDLLSLIHIDEYALEPAARTLNMVPTKKDTLDKLQQRSVKCIFIGYPKETMGYYFYFPPENKIVVVSEIPMKVEGFKPPHEEEAPVHRKGFTQLYGVDYEETFSPVTDIRAIRILIAIAAFYDYEIWQTDVKTSFLNGYLDEDIYMTYLGICFAIKDLGEATFILGIKIYKDRSKRLIGLSQSAYMDKILKRYKMDNSKCVYIPMQERLDLNKTQGASTPGENPGEPHWTAVKTILKYLRNTKDMFLVYGGNPEAELRVDCYCNAGFKVDRDDIKSQTGYVFISNERRNRLEKLQAKYYCNVRYRS